MHLDPLCSVQVRVWETRWRFESSHPHWWATRTALAPLPTSPHGLSGVLGGEGLVPVLQRRLEPSKVSSSRNVPAPRSLQPCCVNGSVLRTCRAVADWATVTTAGRAAR
jgi:hypothetical protein